MPTPFDANDEVNVEALAALVRFAVASGVHAICLPAYGSEFYKLSDDEREVVVDTAVHASSRAVAVIAQSNHPSAKVAADIARRNEARGADAIGLALPRQFSLAEDDLLRYAIRVATAVRLPVLIQDFNPGGSAVGADFARRLKEAVPNFAYLKLEEPLMGGKVAAIRNATHDQVGVLEGWGGMHLLELLPVGIAGIMPGLAVCDLLRRVIDAHGDGRAAAAQDLFERVLPFIVYSLQSMEIFHHCEKRLLRARGLLTNTAVRDAGLELGPSEIVYIENLLASIVTTL